MARVSRWIGLVLLIGWSGLALAASGAGNAPAAHPKSVINASALTGLWYAPSQNGHGFALTFDDAGRVAATWYVYQGTRQVWLIGSGSLAGNLAVLPTVITTGGNFPPGFNPNQVSLSDWGSLTLNVQACDRINVAWNSTVSGFGSGTLDLVPLIVGGGLPCAVSLADDYGDSCARASAVPPSGSLSGRIDPAADEDFFRIDVAARGALVVRSRAQVGLDPIGAILDGNCQLLVENDDADAKDFAVAATLDPGTYYVRIGSYAQSTAGNYSLDFSFDTAVGADDFGDSCAAAGSIALGGSVAGRIDPQTDIDFFRIVLDRGGVLLASSGGTDALDPVGTILDANCQVVVENDDFDGHDFAVSTGLAAGTYFISVRSYNADTSGTYTLSARLIDSSGDDHGDFCSAATAFVPGATLSGQINPTADEDFFAFTTVDPGTLVFATFGTSTLDPVATIFDGTCRGFTDDDDSGPGANSAMTVAISPGTYYLRVRGSGTTTGAYSASTRFIASVAGTDEHGNSCGSATALTSNGGVYGRIEPASDQDFFRLDLDEGGTLAAVSYSDVLDPAGAILDANCQLLAEDDDGGDNGIDFRVSAPVQPGTYFLRVRSAPGTTTGEYLMTYGVAPPEQASPAVSETAAAATSNMTFKPTETGTSFTSRNATAWPEPKQEHVGAKTVTNPAALSGLWYDPAQSGQGVQITFNPAATVALTWYVYSGTRQLWLIGSAPLQGNRVTLPMFISNGADFPPAFDPNAVTLTAWGSITLDVRSCSSILMSWAPTLPGFGPGSMDLQPLIVSGGLTCAVSADTDDHGNDCASASAATLGSGSAGRIDPSSDVDVFRLSVGSAGTLTVQSSGSSTLNPSGTLLDAGCNALAQNDDSAGREFAISRAVAAGTYYVRVASANGASVGDYVMGSSFVPTSGGGTSMVTVNLRDDLVYDLDFRLNGGTPIRVGAGASVQQTVSVSGALSVSFQLVDAVNAQGQPIGDLIGGAFDPVANPTGAVSFTVDNQVGAQSYFAPVMSNKTATPFLVGVNMGLPTENRCNCTVAGGAKDTRTGYYLLAGNSNVRAYGVNSGYTGSYFFWGSDPGGGGTALFTVPLSNLVETPSGRVGLKYVVFGQ